MQCFMSKCMLPHAWNALHVCVMALCCHFPTQNATCSKVQIGLNSSLGTVFEGATIPFTSPSTNYTQFLHRVTVSSSRLTLHHSHAVLGAQTGSWHEVLLCLWLWRKLEQNEHIHFEVYRWILRVSFCCLWRHGYVNWWQLLLRFTHHLDQIMWSQAIMWTRGRRSLGSSMRYGSSQH